MGDGHVDLAVQITVSIARGVEPRDQRGAARAVGRLEANVDHVLRSPVQGGPDEAATP